MKPFEYPVFSFIHNQGLKNAKLRIKDRYCFLHSIIFVNFASIL